MFSLAGSMYVVVMRIYCDVAQQSVHTVVSALLQLSQLTLIWFFCCLMTPGLSEDIRCHV